MSDQWSEDPQHIPGNAPSHASSAGAPHERLSGSMDDKEDTWRKEFSAPEKWLRLIFILLFAIIFNIAEFLLAALVVLQFFFTLFTGRANARLLSFSQNFRHYIFQVVGYLTYNTDTRPFPFGAWPGDEDVRGTTPREAAGEDI